MHLNRRKALGIAIPVLLGGALAVGGAAALPARAATWQDTGLSGGAVTDSTFGGSGLEASNGDGVIDLIDRGVVTGEKKEIDADNREFKRELEAAEKEAAAS